MTLFSKIVENATSMLTCRLLDLVDTFLLPCLVPAIHYLCAYLKIDQEEQKSAVKVLQLILLPSSISGEASTMLTSVKNLIAKPLEQSLRSYQRKDPGNQDIEPLLNALKDNQPLSRRTGGADLSELEGWNSTSNMGLGGCVRHNISNFCQWSLNAGANSTPTSYTHRQLNASVQLSGAKRMLMFMLEEVRQQTEPRSISFTYDIVTAMICAPDVTTEPGTNTPPGMFDASGNVPPQQPKRPASLRDALRAMAEQCKKIQKVDAALADIVVRLHRRVEAQLSFPPPQALLPDANMEIQLTEGDAAALDDAMAAAAAAGGDAMQVDGGLDMSGLGDLSALGDGTGVGDLDGTGGDDIFDGLDTTDINFDDWGSLGGGMDMS